MELSTKQKKANRAMTLAVAATKRKLAPKAKKKTITTYPKGEWKDTLEKELKIAARNQGLKPSKRKTASSSAVKKSKSTVKRKKKIAPKYPTLGGVKKSTAKKPAAKKATAKKTATKKKSTAKKSTAKKKTGLIASIKKVFS